jgi:hypothetical protein
MWIGEGGPAGDGRFVYVDNPRDPLRFTRGVPGAAVPVIQPQMMYTDGGSIPRAGQMFRGFSPWGYAPAYMVHDWLFVARHCLNDGTPTPEEQALAALTFQDSASIIAEAIKTLIASGKVQPDDVAPRVISGAVTGPISNQSWTAKGACAADRVSKADREAARAAIPGAPQRALSGLRRVLPDGTVVDVRPATVVAQISF